MFFIWTIYVAVGCEFEVSECGHSRIISSPTREYILPPPASAMANFLAKQKSPEPQVRRYRPPCVYVDDQAEESVTS